MQSGMILLRKSDREPEQQALPLLYSQAGAGLVTRGLPGYNHPEDEQRLLIAPFHRKTRAMVEMVHMLMQMSWKNWKTDTLQR